MTFRHEAVLVATLARWRTEPFAWHADNCIMSCFDYGREITGIDCGSPWRGRYHDEASAMALMEADGGGLAVMERGLSLGNGKRVQRPERGDVICARFGEHEIGGICTGEEVEFRMERGSIGITMRHLDIRAAWRFA